MARSKRSNGNKASDIKTQNNAPISSSDYQTQASLESQQYSKDELMLIIQFQGQKIQNLTNRLNNLEQLVREKQSDGLLLKRTSELLERSWWPQTVLQTVLPHDLGCQAPRRQKQRNCSRNYRESEGASHSQPIDPTELDNEIDKVHRLPLTNKQKQTEKTPSPNIIYKFKTYSYREKLFSKRNELHNNSNKKINSTSAWQNIDQTFLKRRKTTFEIYRE